MKRKYCRILTLVGLAVWTSTMGLRAAEAEDRTQHNYLELVRAYADAMIADGRDSYGAEHSPLFASAMDRTTMQIGTFPGIPGVREGDRSLTGANPQTEYGLYELLYGLTELVGDTSYASEADHALKYFFTHCQSPKTGLMAWCMRVSPLI